MFRFIIIALTEKTYNLLLCTPVVHFFLTHAQLTHNFLDSY